MRFSIIIPSYLGPYNGAAMNRPAKLIRAVESCLAQTFQDFEIIVVADGCEETFNIIDNYIQQTQNEKIICGIIAKQEHFSGFVRNRGIYNASGEYIVYLDADDKFGVNHLQKINNEIDNIRNTRTISFGRTIVGKDSNDGPDWIWFNDFIWKRGQFIERNCAIKQYGNHGTSNICHRRDLNVWWNSKGYGREDFAFVKGLKSASDNYVKIPAAEYLVCHIPGAYDV